MKITPKTEKQIQEENLFQPGIYDFEVVGAEDKISKIKPDGTGGNEMVVLTLKVFGNNRSLLVDDYLMDSMAFKLRHACDACGLLKQYESGQLTADMFYGKVGKAKFKIQIDKNGEYPDKNVVADYVKKESGDKAAKEVDDDSVPF